MACFCWLPNEILENIFQHLDFKTRRNLSLVCRRWNEVLLSERYLRKHAILRVEGCRLLNGKMSFERDYDAISIKLDDQHCNEMTKNLRLVNAISPSPEYLRIDNRGADQRFALVLNNVFFSLENVEQLHLLGTCKTEKGYLCHTFNNLKSLKIESTHVEYLKFIAPQLNELYLYVSSEDHMDLLPQFADQLVKLTVVFESKDIYYFYNLTFPFVTELSIDRRLKGMTKSEQNISIAFFRRLPQLQKLHISVKFIDSYVMQMISTGLPNLTELSLIVSEGTIQLSNISKLVQLEKLKIEAEKVNLLDAHFRHLKHLTLGSSDFRTGTYVYAFESLMLIDSLRVLGLHNVKFYPEVLKLTPSYNIGSMYITNYKRLDDGHLQMLVRRFPAVRWLKIAHCPGFTAREIEKLKRMNPKLCVAFDEVTQGRMTLLFLGFFDQIQDDSMSDDQKMGDMSENSGKTVQVETVLLKISHNKRKDISSALMQVAVGKSEVMVNPVEKVAEDKVPTISIATESFSSVGINQVAGPQLSFLLLFRVHMHCSTESNYCAISNGTDGFENGGSDDEPSSKRQKLSGTNKLFGTELIIYDKYGRCLLKEGDYELTVQEILPHQQQMQKYNSPKKNATWETIQPLNGDRHDMDIIDIYKQNGIDDQNPILMFRKSPSLKFRLQWTKEALPVLVDRPQPLSIVLNSSNDKENHKPDVMSSTFKRNLSININNNSILTPAAATGNSNVPTPLDANTGALVPMGASYPTPGSTELKLYADEPKIDHIIYQFVYNNNSRQQTETKSDFHCPWCSLNCGTLYPLLKHLKLCHARFIFTYIPIPPNGARIDVSINELYDGSYNGSPHDLLGTANAFSRRGPMRRTVVTNLLVCRPRRQKHSLTEFIECDENEFDSQRPFITGHSRMYHHTMTCLPVHPKELDIDSEGESDPLWLQHKTMQMIDEFTDVNEGEKELMKMWNLHVMKYGYVGDCQIPVALDMFIDCRGRDLLRKNLYRNFILHVCSMFDFGLVSPEVMQNAIRKLQNLLFENPDLQKQVATSRKDQMEYWNTVTVHKQAQPKIEKATDRAGAGASGTPSTPSHKAGSAGSGSDKRVKPTMTPAKNNFSIVANAASSSSISTIDKNAISQSRRRSASAALHSNSSLANNTANKDTHHSSAHPNPSQTSSYASPHSNKRSSTSANNSSIGNATRSSNSSGNSGSSSANKTSTITTRRKSLSVATQRKRSIN